MRSILPGCIATEPGAGIALPGHACNVGRLEAEALQSAFTLSDNALVI
jgi:hypothetical protein